MEKKRPRLDPDELQQLRWLLGGALALIAIAGVWALDVRAGALAGLAFAAVLAALVRPDLPARVPARVHTLAFPAIVAWFACDLYLTGEVLPAMIRLNLLLLLYRGVSYRRKRDDLQIIALGLILVMATGVLTVSLSFAAQILLFTAVALSLLFVITLMEAAGAGGAAAAGRLAPASGREPAWARCDWRRLGRRAREVADFRLLALGGLLYLGVVAVSALLFVSVPRFQIDSGFFLGRLLTAKSRTGFSDSIKLGDVVDIQQDDSVALRVDVSDAARVPVVPYWRMVVLDEYRSGEFRTSRRLLGEMAVSTRMRSFVPGMLPPPREPPVFWTFYLEAGISRYLPLTGPFHQLRLQEPQWVQRQARLGSLALRNEPATMTAYRVEGMRADGEVPDPDFAGGLRAAREAPADNAARPAAAAERRASYPLTTLELPAAPGDLEALRRAVAAITGGLAPGPREFAARAAGWLVRKHGYSLKVALPPGPGDPAVRWLESDLPGHCELFTAAFTLLSRAAGFPTRAVTGFRGGDWNGFENYFMVRNSQAHAWCEVYDGNSGWFRVDPTAGAPVVSAADPGLAAGVDGGRRLDRSWQARLDALRIIWYRRIVNFDQRAQVELLTSLREAVTRLRASLRSAMAGAGARLGAWIRRPWHLLRAAGWLGAAAAGVAAAAWWWRRGRPWWWRVRGPRAGGRPDPVRRCAGRWLRKLAPRRAASAGGSVIAELQRLRYGPRATWPEPAAVFARARSARAIANRK